MSPLKIDMLLRYNGCITWDYWEHNNTFPDAKGWVDLPPAYIDGVEELAAWGLLSERAYRTYSITPKGSCYAEFLMNAPFPTPKQPETEWEVVL